MEVYEISVVRVFCLFWDVVGVIWYRVRCVLKLFKIDLNHNEMFRTD